MTDNPRSINAEDNIRHDLGPNGGWRKGALGAVEANNKVSVLEKEIATDHLTHLESAREVKKNLIKITRENTHACALFCDIDHFKDVNDTYSHDVGNVFLENLGLRIASTISKGDHAGRWGGEEFIVLIENLNDLDIAKARAEKIRSSIGGSPFVIGDTKIDMTISVGVSVRKSSEKWKDWIERADRAMYLAKVSGRNNVKTELDLVESKNV